MFHIKRSLNSKNFIVCLMIDELSSPLLKKPFSIDIAFLQVKYVLDALELISLEGWKLLPQYILSLDTGEWSHFTNSTFADCRSLHSIQYKEGTFKFEAESRCGTHKTFSLPDNLLKAKETLRIFQLSYPESSSAFRLSFCTTSHAHWQRECRPE